MWKSQLKSLPTVCSPGMLSVVRGEPAKARLKAVRQSSSPLLAMKSTKLFSSWNLRKHPRGDTSLIQGAGGTERPVWGPGVGSTSQWGQTLGPPRTERAVLWDPCWERGACATADERQGRSPGLPCPHCLLLVLQMLAGEAIHQLWRVPGLTHLCPYLSSGGA